MLQGECSSSCLHSGETCGICHILVETNSVTRLQHSYHHVAPNLTLIFCTCLKLVGNAQNLIVEPPVILQSVWQQK